MKLSEYKNEDALELLADIIDPISNIMQDEELVKLARSKNSTKIKIIQYLLKNHSKEVVQVFARIKNVTVEEYNGTIMSMTQDLIDLFNDKDIIDFFTSQGLMKNEISSGPAMVNIKAGRK